MKRYEIKNKDGKTIYTTDVHGFATEYYWTVRENEGYAELWYGGNLIFKTR